MAKGAKGGSVYVEIVLDKEQFDKDFKAASREIASVQKQLSMELERNKVKFAVDGTENNWAEKLFGATAIGKIQAARKETEFLNTQIGFQKNKVDVASAAWNAMVQSKGALAAATVSAEKAFLREQMALVGLKKDLEGTTSASMLMGGMVKSAAMTAAATVAAMSATYVTAVKAAVEWGQAVNDISDETGMADEEAARLMGTMNVVGMGAEDAAASLAKLTKSVNAAAQEQAAAAKTGAAATDVFTKFKIAITDGNGNLLSYSDILANITEKHREMSDGLQKTAMEMAIFGKSGYKLNDLLNMTAERSAEIALKLDKLGLTLGIDSQKSENLNFQLNEMHLAFKSIANTVAGDDIAAITKLIEKFTELAIWIRENKDAVNEAKDMTGNFIQFVAGPTIIKPIEAVIGALKKLIELRQKYLSENRARNPSGDAATDNIAAQDKSREEAQKKQAEAADAARKKQNESLLEQAKNASDLQTALLTIQGFTLQVTLKNIDIEERAWSEKCKNAAAVSEWAEAARAKAHEDAQQRIDSSLKNYENALKQVQSASAGIGSTFQGAFGSAINEVVANLKAGKNAGADAAVRKMQTEYELQKRASQAVATASGQDSSKIAAGWFDPVSAQEQMAKAFDALNEATKNADTEKINYLKVIAQNTGKDGVAGNGSTRPVEVPSSRFTENSGDKVIPGQNLTISVPVTVNVNGMDAASAEQLGQIAAQKILPEVKAAISGNSSY